MLLQLQNNIFSRLFVGQNVVVLTAVDSTNNFLKNELSKSAPLPEGTVIMAETQFAGRGQQTNKWHSEPGKNLTISILLKPSFLNIHEQFLLNKAICISINEALHKLIGNGIKIKWPNDIYFNDNKLGGILIENILQGDKWKYAIIGIGLNVNQVTFPDELTNVTSISKILQSNYDLKVLLSEICSHIEAWYLKLRSGKKDEINEIYLSRLYRYKESHQFQAENKQFTGMIVGINESGMLLVKQDDDSVKSFIVKEIEFLKD